MRKIVVIGPGGAGKSTLAKQLGELLDLPVFHLDSIYWKPGWKEPSKTEWLAIVHSILEGDQWIIDGNYSGTLEHRLGACEAVVFLDFPRRICIWRTLTRMFKYSGTVRSDMAPGCPERLNFGFLIWIWNYPKRSRPKVLSLLKNSADAKHVYHLRSQTEVNQFLLEVSS